MQFSLELAGRELANGRTPNVTSVATRAAKESDGDNSRADPDCLRKF